MKHLAPVLFLLVAAPVRAQHADTTALVRFGNVAAWDIEFHFLTSRGEYVQDLQNPYDAEQRGIGSFANGRLNAYYFKDRGRCFTALPSRYLAAPALVLSVSSCRLFDFFEEQVWLVRNGAERVRLEAPLRKTAVGTDY